MSFGIVCGWLIASEAVLAASDWDTYKQAFAKIYSGDEDDYRRSIFEQNLALYARLNALEPLAHYGPTALSDLTPAEYRGGYKPSNITLPELDVDTSLAVPTHRDWTGIYTTQIKDQNSCGACWAISAISQVESDAMREHNWTGVLSTQELVDCTSKGQGSWRGGCGGGNPTDGYQVLQALGGAASGWVYKYESRDAECHINNYTKYVGLQSYKTVGKHDEAVMKSYVATTGPLSVCVDATDWSGYAGGIKTTCGKSVDHCVQIVGFGEHKGTSYWKVRNSWGAEWGENGYMRLKIGDNLCNIASGPTATSTSIVTPSPHPAPSKCKDKPETWRSSEGDPCSIYDLNSYCSADGHEGKGWNICSWGSIKDYADPNGITALEACCACGGGTNPVTPAPPAPSSPHKCTDKPKTWRSSEGDSCCTYGWDSYCTPEGGEGRSWDHAAWGPISDYADKNGISALQACCVCGGGSKNN